MAGQLNTIESGQFKILRQGSRDTLLEALQRKLEEGLATAQFDGLRVHQKNGYHQLMEHLKKGGHEGIFIEPTGAGKTRLFGVLIKSMQAPALVLVPSKGLVDQTAEAFGQPEIGLSHVHRLNLDDADSENTAAAALNKIRQQMSREPSDQSPVVIMTYHSFLRLYTDLNGDLLKLLSLIKVKICDEAHRSLGKNTVGALNSFSHDKGLRKFLLKILEEKNGTETEDVIHIPSGLIHRITDFHFLRLFFTATPELFEKEVTKTHEIPVIHRTTIGELVQKGILILPQPDYFGDAVFEERKSESELDTTLEDEKFMMTVNEKKMSVLDAVLERYLQRKNDEVNAGKLPAIAFCRTIQQATTFEDKAVKKGLRVGKVVSDEKREGSSAERIAVDGSDTDDTEEHSEAISIAGESKGNLSEKVAGQLIKEGKLDIVITCRKGGEGWNVPELRCALWLTPTRSPARYLQGIGRIMRKSEGKSTVNTINIRPNWYGKKQRKKGPSLRPGASPSRTTEGQSSSSYEFELELIEAGEMDSCALIKQTRGNIEEAIEKKPIVEILSDLTNQDAKDKILAKILLHPLDWIRGGFPIIPFQIYYHEKERIEAKSLLEHMGFENDEIERVRKFLLRTFPKAKELLFDAGNKDHLRELIGSIDRLIENGKPINLYQHIGPPGTWCPKYDFENKKRRWGVDGETLAKLTGKDARALALELFPEEAEKRILE